MKIALLNLPFDNNYGGNLQRYALMQVLQDMGYDVTHLNVCFTWYSTKMPGRFPLYTLGKRIARKILKDWNTGIYPERHNKQRFINDNKSALPFYNKYVKHTKQITSYKELCKYRHFDAYIVGSDQVWRKKMTVCYPFSSLFFDFLRGEKVKRIAYGCSFGTDKNELNNQEIKELGELYNLFDATSVREDSGLKLIEGYGWKSPKPSLVLDPTLLLNKERYIDIIKNGNTKPSKGNMFCYVLDSNENTESVIRQEAEKRNLKPFKMSINSEQMFSIEQWLRSFLDSKYIVTDSFHGFVFSIIFNKPVKLMNNPFRGNERFDSLKRVLEYNPDSENIDWVTINDRINQRAKDSIAFLQTALKNKL